MMKVHAKKVAEKAKPGTLLSSHIEYGANGGAAVTHRHEPTPRKDGDPWSDGSTMPQHFTSREDALHHVAQTCGVKSMIDEPEDAAEMAHGKKPSKKEEKAEGERA